MRQTHRPTADALRKAARLLAQQPSDAFHAKLNIYVCDACRGHIVTRDKHPGVTPFMTSCHATDGCKGSMKSSMYRVFDQDMLEDHEWYRPKADEVVLSPHAWDHVSKGGLLLRKRVS